MDLMKFAVLSCFLLKGVFCYADSFGYTGWPQNFSVYKNGYSYNHPVVVVTSQISGQTL